MEEQRVTYYLDLKVVVFDFEVFRCYFHCMEEFSHLFATLKKSSASSLGPNLLCLDVCGISVFVCDCVRVCGSDRMDRQMSSEGGIVVGTQLLSDHFISLQ